MIALLLILPFLLPCQAMAANVIGHDPILHVNTIPFLVDESKKLDQYAMVFNYFFTIELLCALIGLFFRWIGRVLRS